MNEENILYVSKPKHSYLGRTKQKNSPEAVERLAELELTSPKGGSVQDAIHDTNSSNRQGVWISPTERYEFEQSNAVKFSEASNVIRLAKKMILKNGVWVEGERVVIKELPRYEKKGSGLPKENNKNTYGEIRRMRGFAKGDDGDRMVQVLDVGYSNDKLFCVMEFMDGTDCDQVINKIDTLTTRQIAGSARTENTQKSIQKGFEAKLLIFARMLEAHKALGKNWVHNDIKGSNFLYDKKKGVKACDVEFATLISEQRKPGGANKIVDNPRYKAPEILEGESSGGNFLVDQKADVWSMGIMLYSIIQDAIPFDGQWAVDIEADIKKFTGELTWNGIGIPTADRAAFKKLVMSMLQRNPADRPSVDDLLKNPLLQRVLGKSKELEGYIHSAVSPKNSWATGSKPIRKRRPKNHEKDSKVAGGTDNGWNAASPHRDPSKRKKRQQARQPTKWTTGNSPGKKT